MKIITLLRDGRNQLHLAQTRAPDQMRRELSAQTGTAVIVWCGVPPEGVGGTDLIAATFQRLGVETTGLSQIPACRIKATLVDLCEHEPRRVARRRRVRHALRRARNWLFPGTRKMRGMSAS